jgi:endonuclease/exonuclease/phosphatase family metal-dependent hydrolase
MVLSTTTPPSCRQAASAYDGSVRWFSPDDRRDIGRLGAWCGTVGPLLIESPQPAAVSAAVAELAVLTWNVHVGGGDIEHLIGRLRAGEFTDGRPVADFVLLLQEAFRAGDDVPADVGVQAAVPHPIVVRPPNGAERRDIRTVARRLGVHVFYAPSMRNSRDASPAPVSPREDRGSAILSTLPLADLQVIELPFERQRRVALAATVSSSSARSGSWRLRVADVHFDTALSLTRGGPFAARRRQAEALVEALDARSAGSPVPTIVGGDFNTWLGPAEPAIDVMRRAFSDTPDQPAIATWEGPALARAVLDYVFVRGRFETLTTRRLAERFGSDHYPLLTIVEF